ncbi:DUF262 domain-containing protein [Clavibacter zhangzhiyongii]|uniref:DUF262 domain-containing protein n=1 Tax=Clavibacter zhangzhiyongii TaxID=2768071 RepID=UPI0039E17502
MSALIDGIDNGQVVLPNFQRDFVWSESDVKMLLGTALSDWPMGSLLLIEGSGHRSFYSPRPIELAPEVAEELVYIILDGQQRLTSLYQALVGKGKSVYALRLSRAVDLQNVDSLDESIVAIPHESWDKAVEKAEQRGDFLLPFSALRDASAFYEWRDQREMTGDTRAWLIKTYRDNLSSIHTYRVPAVIVDSRIEPQAVARVFERVNRTGLKLGTFDLMVAKSYSDVFNLRTAWEVAREHNPVLVRMLGDDGLPILSAMALRAYDDVRASAVLSLSAEDVQREWDEAVEHFVNAALFAESKLGVLDAEWLPYRQMLTVMAALDYVKPIVTVANLVSKWFWHTGFGLRYDVASNTRAANDYRALVVLKDPTHESLTMVRQPLLEATRGQLGAWHRAYLCALAVDAHKDSDTRESMPRPRSVFVRGRGSLTPPLHLRTLTFALFADDGSRIPSPLAASSDMGETVSSLDAQLDRLEQFIATDLSLSVQVIGADEVGEGESLFGDIIDELDSNIGFARASLE